MIALLSRVPIGGGAVVQLMTQINAPLGLAIDATALYVTASGGGRVWKVSPL